MIADLKPYAEYKESGLAWLGRMPGHWRVVRNGGLFGQRNETGYRELPILEVSLKTGIRARKFDGSARKQVMSDKDKYKRALKGDVAYNMMRMWQGAVGVSPIDGLVSPAYVVARPHANVEPDYFVALFRTGEFMSEIDNCSRGIVKDRNRLYWGDFKQMQSPCPPPEEQAVIVRYLDWANGRLERAIRAKRKVIALLGEQKQAIINRAVTRGLDPAVPVKPTGVSWLGDIPKHWDVRRLRASIADCVNGIWGADPDGESDLTCVRVADFDRRKLRVSLKRKTIRAVPVSARARRLLHSGDLLLEKSGGGERQPVGAVVMYEFEEAAVCSNFVARMAVAPGYHSGFLSYLHSALYALRLTIPSIKQTTGIQNLDHKSYLAERVAFPDLVEQEAISLFLDSEGERFSHAISRLESEIDLLREYRTRLVADVVTGKLDVREAAAKLPGPEPDAETEDSTAYETEEALPEEDA